MPMVTVSSREVSAHRGIHRSSGALTSSTIITKYSSSPTGIKLPTTNVLDKTKSLYGENPQIMITPNRPSSTLRQVTA